MYDEDMAAREECSALTSTAHLAGESSAVLIAGGQQDIAAGQVAVQDVEVVQVRQRTSNLKRSPPVEKEEANTAQEPAPCSMTLLNPCLCCSTELLILARVP